MASKKCKMIKEKINKKGISPVIATVLLIAIVIILGLIIFLWFRGMTQEAITKFGGRNIELVCGEVNFDASYSSATGIISILNIGNVPIYNMRLKISEPGQKRTIDLNVELAQGKGASKNINEEINNPTQLVLIPVLLGTTSNGENKAYICNEKQYGYNLM